MLNRIWKAMLQLISRLTNIFKYTFYFFKTIVSNNNTFRQNFTMFTNKVINKHPEHQNSLSNYIPFKNSNLNNLLTRNNWVLSFFNFPNITIPINSFAYIIQFYENTSKHVFNFIKFISPVIWWCLPSLKILSPLSSFTFPLFLSIRHK